MRAVLAGSPVRDGLAPHPDPRSPSEPLTNARTVLLMRCPAHGLIEVTFDPRFEEPCCPRIVGAQWCGVELEPAGYFAPVLIDVKAR